MILASPYLDPLGKFNEALRRRLPLLKTSFEAICLSVVPPTFEKNAAFVRYLESQGCYIHRNEPDSLHGQHSRAALRLAVEQASAEQPVYFGFLDRILFALETDYRETFLEDVLKWQEAEFVAFERSEEAWQTHPANYREVEGMVSRLGELMFGQFLDLTPCSFLFGAKAARTVLDQSTSRTTEVWGEWTLLAIKNRIPVSRVAVDWLAWEDPYWEGVEPDSLKRQRDISQAEMVKRIKMDVPTMLLLTEERFKHIRALADQNAAVNK